MQLSQIYRYFLIVISLLMSYFFPISGFSLVFPMPQGGNSIVGEIRTITLMPNETFFQISRKYNIGYEALVAANPNVDPFKERDKPVPFVIPSRFVLPPVTWKGIVINVAEMRLYYFSEDGREVFIYPIGVGRQGWATPTGNTFILQKIKNPYWHVPDSIREHAASEGVYYPDKVAPGPLDPLGDFALRLNIPGYLIHGTNDPNSVGARSSSGCIRMYAENISELYQLVKKNMPVRIIDAPFKIGVENNKLYLEAHPSIENNQFQEVSDVTPMLNAILADAQNLKAEINWKIASTVAKQHLGLPEPIGKLERIPPLSMAPSTSDVVHVPKPVTLSSDEKPSVSETEHEQVKQSMKTQAGKVSTLPDDLPDSNGAYQGAPVENGVNF